MTTVRSRSTIALTVAALGLLLAGCDSSDDATSSPAPGSSASSAATATSAATASAAATASSADANASGTDCGYDPAATYLAAGSAAEQGGTVVVTGNPAQFVCGGADNGHFQTDQDTITLQLAPSADIELLAGSGPDLDPTPVPPADLPARLAAQSGALFQVTGPDTAVTGLTELYRP